MNQEYRKVKKVGLRSCVHEFFIGYTVFSFRRGTLSLEEYKSLDGE